MTWKTFKWFWRGLIGFSGISFTCSNPTRNPKLTTNCEFIPQLVLNSKRFSWTILQTLWLSSVSKRIYFLIICSVSNGVREKFEFAISQDMSANRCNDTVIQLTIICWPLQQLYIRQTDDCLNYEYTSICKTTRRQFVVL